jgi:hypothetical protein
MREGAFLGLVVEAHQLPNCLALLGRQAAVAGLLVDLQGECG